MRFQARYLDLDDSEFFLREKKLRPVITAIFFPDIYEYRD